MTPWDLIVWALAVAASVVIVGLPVFLLVGANRLNKASAQRRLRGLSDR